MQTEEILDNPNAPHVAVFKISYEIMEKMPTGELTGRPMKDGELLIEVLSSSLKDCIADAEMMFSDLKIQAAHLQESTKKFKEKLEHLTNLVEERKSS